MINVLNVKSLSAHKKNMLIRRLMAYWYKDFESKTFKEVAELLKVKEPTARSLYFYGLHEIRYIIWFNCFSEEKRLQADKLERINNNLIKDFISNYSYQEFPQIVRMFIEKVHAIPITPTSEERRELNVAKIKIKRQIKVKCKELLSKVSDATSLQQIQECIESPILIESEF